MIHLGAWSWPSGAVDPQAYTNLPANDKIRLTHWGGGVPFLAYAFSPGYGNYAPQTWQWLSERGYRDAVIRLWGPVGGDPAAYVDGLRTGIDNALRAKMDCILQPANEPNIETTLTAAEFAAWEGAVIDELRRVYPTCQIASSPLAQDAPNTAEWRAAQLPNLAKCDYQGWHYYWGRKPGDDQPGAPESPEWAYQQYGRPLVVSECGDWSPAHNIAPVCQRWLELPYIRSLHVFIMSSPGFPTFNFTDDDANTMYELCKRWRQVRRYPPSAAAAPCANYDSEDLRIARNLGSRIRSRVQSALAVLGGIDSDAQEAIDRINMAGVP